MERIRKNNDGGKSANPDHAVQRKPASNSALGDFAARIDNSPLMAAQRKKLQSLFGGAVQMEKAPSPKPNQTGLPDQLKAGIENLAGLSMDHVRVHYNSTRPAQLNAHAYAQGSDIHVAPGQEQHLPHEAWHVVQQAQGRVRPTMQMKGGVPVNDDQGLEREADVMGARAATVVAAQTKSMKSDKGDRRAHGFSGAIEQDKSAKKEWAAVKGCAQRKAEVLAFGSDWKLGALAARLDQQIGGGNAYFELRVGAVFSNENGNDPKDVEFVQEIMDHWERKDRDTWQVIGTSEWHDDGYSLSDNTLDSETEYRMQDYPGLHFNKNLDHGLRPQHNIRGTFGARHKIIEKSTGRILAMLGPHYAYVTGAHPRIYAGVPHREGNY